MSNITILIPELGNKYIDYRNGVWGDSYSWDFPRTVDQVKYLCVHHSVTNPTGNWKEEVDHIANLHKTRGWAGIGYHYVVASDGMVAYVGDIGMGRANVAGQNEKVIGICFVGDFTKHLPTDEQIKSGHILLKFFLNLRIFPNIYGWEHVVGHKDLSATACPGSNWKGVPDSFYERLKNNIPYTAPTTTQTTSVTTQTTTLPATTPQSPSTTQSVPAPVENEAICVLRSIDDVFNDRGWWWIKYAKVKSIINKHKHLWR